jgi:hypothetical protein
VSCVCLVMSFLVYVSRLVLSKVGGEKIDFKDQKRHGTKQSVQVVFILSCLALSFIVLPYLVLSCFVLSYAVLYCILSCVVPVFLVFSFLSLVFSFYLVISTLFLFSLVLLRFVLCVRRRKENKLGLG